MGILTRVIEGAVREIVPMGRPETKKNYPSSTKVKDMVRDSGMDPNSVDVIGDGEDVDLDENIGDRTSFTILPKQKGGNEDDFGEEILQLLFGYILDPNEQDAELWDKLDRSIGG